MHVWIRLNCFQIFIDSRKIHQIEKLRRVKVIFIKWVKESFSVLFYLTRNLQIHCQLLLISSVSFINRRYYLKQTQNVIDTVNIVIR